MANDMKLQFNIGASFAELKSAVTQAKAELKSLVDTVKQAGQEVKIKVGLDIAGLNNDIQSLKATVRNALQGSATEKIKVKIEADAAAIRADILAIRPQIQQALSSFAPISLTVNHAKLAQHLQAAEAQVRAAIARMTTPTALRLNLNIDSTASGLIKAINELKVEVNGLKQVMARGGGRSGTGGSGGGGLGGASSDVNGFASAIRDARNQLMQLVSVFGVLIGIKAFASITDEAKSLESKLKLVTSSQEELNQVTAALREIAKNNLQGLAPTVELYSKLSSGTKSLEGANTALNTRLADIVSKLVTISGSTGPAAEGAIIQFGQALSGNFSAAGQELNSIIEQAPALADAIAKSYGVTRGELKKLGADGKITAEGVVNGLIRQGVEVDALFGKVNKTIGGTATTTGEALKLLIVDIDKTIGLSDAMISTLVAIRDNLSEIVLVAKLVGSALFVAFAPAIANMIAVITVKIIAFSVSLVRATAAATGLRAALLSIQGVFAILGSAMAGWSIGTYLKEQFIEVELAGIALARGLTVLFQNIKGGFKEIGLALEFAFTNPLEIVKTVLLKLILWMASVAGKIPAFGDGLANSLFNLAEKIAPSGEAGAAFLDKLQELRKSVKQEVDLTKGIYDELADAAIQANTEKNKPKVDDKSLGTVKTPKKPSSTDPFAIEKSRLEAELQNIEDKYSAEQIGMNKYFMEKKRILELLHQNEIDNIQAKIDKEKDADKKGDLMTKLEVAKIAKKSAIDSNNINWQKARKDAQEKSEEMLKDIKLEGIANKFDKLDEELKTKREKLLKEFKEQTLNGYEDQAEAAKKIAEYEIDLDRRTNEAIAKNNLDRIQEEIKTFIDLQANKVKNTELLKDRGQISNADAKLGTDLVNQQTLNGLAAYQERIRALNMNDIPEAKRLLDELAQKMAEVPVQATTNFDVFFANTNEKLKQTGVEALKSGLSDFFMDIASNAKSGSEAIKDFARGFAQSMARVAADALATIAVLQILNAVSGGKFALVNGTIGLKQLHTGGIAGIDGQSRKVDMSLFNAAPRYHAGGIAGLQPGEVPAILQRGEEVLTQKDPRHVANGGGQGGGVRIINNIDPNLMHDYLSSSSGEQVIVNLIERNSGTIKQLLV